MKNRKYYRSHSWKLKREPIRGQYPGKIVLLSPFLWFTCLGKKIQCLGVYVPQKEKAPVHVCPKIIFLMFVSLWIWRSEQNDAHLISDLTEKTRENLRKEIDDLSWRFCDICNQDKPPR